MTPDLYAAWLTAGNNLQPYGAWLADWWPLLAVFAVAAAVIGWAWWPHGGDYRSRNDQTRARLITALEQRPEPATPGDNDQLLAACQAICPELARKEDR